MSTSSTLESSFYIAACGRCHVNRLPLTINVPHLSGYAEEVDPIPLRGILRYMKHSSKEAKAKLIKRLKIIEGQVRGLQAMVDKDTYCIDVITQTSAIKRALSSVEDVLMENHLSTCVVDQIQSGDRTKAKAEILKVYQLKRT